MGLFSGFIKLKIKRKTERRLRIKKFICGLLTVLLIILFSTLIFSLNFKKVVVNTISSVVVKEEIVSSINDVVSSFDDKVNDEVLEKVEDNIKQSEAIDEVTEDIFDEVMGYLNNGDEIVIANIDSELEKLIDENKDTLKDYGIEITEDDKQEIIDSIALDDLINEKIEEEVMIVKDNMSSEELFVLNIYNVLTSSTLQIAMVIGIIAITVIIALIKKSLYKWMINVGIALCLVGIINIIGMSMVVNLLSDIISIDIGGIVTNGYIALGIGILLIVIHVLLNKFIKKK